MIFFVSNMHSPRQHSRQGEPFDCTTGFFLWWLSMIFFSLAAIAQQMQKQRHFEDSLWFRLGYLLLMPGQSTHQFEPTYGRANGPWCHPTSARGRLPVRGSTNFGWAPSSTQPNAARYALQWRSLNAEIYLLYIHIYIHKKHIIKYNKYILHIII